MPPPCLCPWRLLHADIPRASDSGNRSRRRPAAEGLDPGRRSSSALSSSRAWLMPAAGGDEDHRRRDPAGQLGGVVEGAAGAAARARPPLRGDGAAARARPGRGRRGSARSARPARRRARSGARRRPPAAAASASESISSSGPASGWRRSTAELGPAGDGGDDPGLEAKRAGRADAAVLAGDPLDRERGLGGGEAGVAADVHRRRPGVGGLAGEGEAVALDPGACRRPRRSDAPRASSTGPCSMWSSR